MVDWGSRWLGTKSPCRLANPDWSRSHTPQSHASSLACSGGASLDCLREDRLPTDSRHDQLVDHYTYSGPSFRVLAKHRFGCHSHILQSLNHCNTSLYHSLLTSRRYILWFWTLTSSFALWTHPLQHGSLDLLNNLNLGKGASSLSNR